MIFKFCTRKNHVQVKFNDQEELNRHINTFFIDIPDFKNFFYDLSYLNIFCNIGNPKKLCYDRRNEADR
jgi:hypothetical protein